MRSLVARREPTWNVLGVDRKEELVEKSAVLLGSSGRRGGHGGRAGRDVCGDGLENVAVVLGRLEVGTRRPRKCAHAWAVSDTIVSHR